QGRHALAHLRLLVLIERDRGRHLGNGNAALLHDELLEDLGHLRELWQPPALQEQQGQITHELLRLIRQDRLDRLPLGRLGHCRALEEIRHARVRQDARQLTQILLPLVELAALPSNLKRRLCVPLGRAGHWHRTLPLASASLAGAAVAGLSQGLLDQARLIGPIQLPRHKLGGGGNRQISDILAELLPRLLLLGLDRRARLLDHLLSLGPGLLLRTGEHLLAVLPCLRQNLLGLAARLVEHLFILGARSLQLTLHALRRLHTLLDAPAPLVEHVGDRAQRQLPEDRDERDERDRSEERRVG